MRESGLKFKSDAAEKLPLYVSLHAREWIEIINKTASTSDTPGLSPCERVD